MHRGQHGRRERRRHELAALDRHLELSAEQGLRGRRPQAHERFRLHNRQLVVYPRTAGVDLALTRLLVDAAFPARFPLEVLDDIRDVDGLPIDAGFFERTVEKLPCRTDERMTPEVFVIARLFADQHERRALRAFAEDRLRGVAPEVAVAAGFCRGTHLRKRSRGHPACTTSAIMPRPLWKGAL